MKSLLLLAFACLPCVPGFSQNLEWTDDFNVYFGVGNSLASCQFVEVTSQGEILVVGKSSFEDWEPGFFVLNQQGSLVAKKFFGLEVGDVIDFEEMQNGDFVFTATGGLCDVCCGRDAFKFD